MKSPFAFRKKFNQAASRIAGLFRQPEMPVVFDAADYDLEPLTEGSLPVRKRSRRSVKVQRWRARNRVASASRALSRKRGH